MSDSQSPTIGVAITVPDPWGEQLQEKRAAFGDSLAWTIPTHITLLPPTRVREARMGRVDEHLRTIAESASPFDVLLDGSDTFRPVSQTSFVVVRQGAAQCAALAERVRSGPLTRSLTFPYHPHVTIAVDLSDEQHDHAETELAGFRLSFPVSGIERYELAEHGVWESAAVFPFSGSDG